MNWRNPKTDIPPEYEEVIIKVMLDVRGVLTPVHRRAVYMQGHFYNTDLDHCITHKVEEWRSLDEK